jgi:hypothetical protein
MNPVYEIKQTTMGEDIIIATYENGRVLSIPTDPANSDYQEYLKSLDETTTL